MFGISELPPQLLFNITGGCFPFLLLFSLLAVTLNLLGRTLIGYYMCQAQRVGRRMARQVLHGKPRSTGPRYSPVRMIRFYRLSTSSMTGSGLPSHQSHHHNNKKGKNVISQLQRQHLLSKPRIGGNFHLHRITPLFWLGVYIVIILLAVTNCMYNVSTDLWLKKQTSKDFVQLLLTEMCIS